MNISGFSIANKKELSNGLREFDLLYRDVLVAKVTVDDLMYDVALDFKSNKKDAAIAGKKLLQRYPHGFDKSYLYNDVGELGIDSAVNYAGEYGNIVFLLEQLIRMDELEHLYIQHNGEKSVVVCKTTACSPLREMVIPNNRLSTLQHDVVIHKGVITFIGAKPSDFDIND